MDPIIRANAITRKIADIGPNHIEEFFVSKIDRNAFIRFEKIFDAETVYLTCVTFQTRFKTIYELHLSTEPMTADKPWRDVENRFGLIAYDNTEIVKRYATAFALFFLIHGCETMVGYMEGKMPEYEKVADYVAALPVPETTLPAAEEMNPPDDGFDECFLKKDASENKNRIHG